MTALKVYLHKKQVGDLVYSSPGESLFTYCASWLNNPQAYPISLSLPLRPEPWFNPGYFRALLPNGNIRKKIEALTGYDQEADLLSLLAGDCIGAVSIQAASGPPEPLSLHERRATQDYGKPYLLLNPPQWQTVLAQLRDRPLLAGEQGIRCCLPSEHSQSFAIYRPGQHVYLPLRGATSSHLVKLMTQPERYCKVLAEAKKQGICVIEAEPMGDHVLSRRYDRELQGADVVCIHQETLTQAMEKSNPSLSEVLRFLQQHSTRPAWDQKQVLQWCIFHYYADGSFPDLQKLSLLLLPEGPRLAPIAHFRCCEVPQKKEYEAEYWQNFAKTQGLKYKSIRLQVEAFLTK